MSNTPAGDFVQHFQTKGSDPFDVGLWKAHITLDDDTGSFEPLSEFDGTVVAVWIDPSTLTPGATIKGYMQDDGLATLGPQYFLDYTVPSPAVETRSALKATGIVLSGKVQVDVAGATANDSFTLYVWVTPGASSSGGGGAATIADGADVTQGAVADAAVAAGAAGTVSAKLRRISTDIAALLLVDINNLVPNTTGGTTDEALTVSDTAGGVQFAAFHADTTYVEFDVQGADVRYTIDGSAPTTSNGHLLMEGSVRRWPKAKAAAAKFFRDDATDAILHCSQLKRG